jgi:hypothetical protein
MRPDYGEVKERYVNDLLARAVAAHGGLVRWSEFSRMTVTIVSGGGLWPMKGLSQDSNPREQTITFHEETASVNPFGQPHWRTASVDLPDDAILDGHAWFRGRRNHALARSWRTLTALRARFPDEIANHSKDKDFYFGEDFLLRRHDYCVDVAGGFPAAQYVYDIVEVEGLRFPIKRRAYLRGPDLKAVRDLLMVSIDLEFRLVS